jgi:ABC-type branched-subunit amino acid transport system ATPase component
MTEALLELEQATVEYGGITVLSNVSLLVEEGEIIALMGPNGAGKSTALKAIFGLVPLLTGRVRWHGELVQPVPERMARRGIAYVPQGRQVFKQLTVRENLELGGYALASREDTQANMREVLNIFPALNAKLPEIAGTLSGGQQQMLTIARALVSDPRVLLLDEPSLGLSPKIVNEVFLKVQEINAVRNIAIVIVEHSIKSVLQIADRVYVLSHGEVVAHTPASELEGSGVLEKAFFGTV